MRFLDQEKHDQQANDNKLKVRDDIRWPSKEVYTDQLQHHRQTDNKCSACERAKYRTQSANDHHEQHEKGFSNAKDLAHFYSAQINGKEQGAGNAHEKRRYRKGA